jgi:type I restriction enzyme R subunit
MPTNTRESGLETLIVNWLAEHNDFEQGTSANKAESR